MIITIPILLIQSSQIACFHTNLVSNAFHRNFASSTPNRVNYLYSTTATGFESDKNGKFSSSFAPVNSTITSSRYDTYLSSSKSEVISEEKISSAEVDDETYIATLPISLTSKEDVASVLGITLRQVGKNRQLSDFALDLDTQQYILASKTVSAAAASGNTNGNSKKASSISEGPMNNRIVHIFNKGLQERVLSPEFEGVIVSSVIENSIAWNAGIRISDVLSATSATLGDKIWPKKTLDGVQSAIQSRKVMSKTMDFQFQRISNKAYVEQSQVVEEFELELTRPIGIEINDSEDGHVVITNFASNDTPASKQLNLGDRIIAVDSITGSQMWPISNVDGLISATTSHLPGQSIRFRFQRVIQVGDYTSDKSSVETGDKVEQDSNIDPTKVLTGAVNGFRELNTGLADTSTAAISGTSPIPSAGSNTHKLLLSRCRDVLRRYKAESTSTMSLTSTATAADSLKKTTAMSFAPVLVADRVLETLGDASAPLDSKTLLLIMNAYTSCRVPSKAIHAFEAATGLSADGSIATTMKKETKINGSNSNSIIPDVQSFDLYTATTLLRAHALNGDYESAVRVLAAMERKAIVVNGIESSLSWPITFTTDVRCYNIVLAAAAKAKGKSALDFALQIFERMADPNGDSKNTNAVEKNVVSYNTMIATFAKARRTQDALTVFYSMRQAKIKPDKYTYTAVLKALVSNKDITGAQELLQEMKEVGVPIDIVTYNTMIKGLCDSLKLYEAQLLINEMESSRGNNKVSPNSMTYCLLMNGLLKAQKPGPCLTLFETAAADERTTSLTENVQMYTTAVTAASRLGDYERALDLVVRMKKVGVKPNIQTLTALMSSCLEANQPETAVKVFTQISKDVTTKGRVKPDGYALSYGIKAYCEIGNFEEASRILTNQKDGNFDMSGKEIMYCYNYLISASLQQHRYDIARSALTELLGAGYIPSKLMFKSILQAMDIPHSKGNKGELSSPESVAQKIENNLNNFKFLLFTLDSLESRKLPCDGIFYANILFECARLGALPRKIGSLLVKSKKRTTEFLIERQEQKSLTSLLNGEHNEIDNNSIVTVPTWISLYENWDSKKYREIDPELPMYRVRIGSKDIRQILSAEQTVSVRGSRTNRRRSGNRKSGNNNKKMTSGVI